MILMLRCLVRGISAGAGTYSIGFQEKSKKQPQRRDEEKIWSMQLPGEGSEKEERSSAIALGGDVAPRRVIVAPADIVGLATKTESECLGSCKNRIDSVLAICWDLDFSFAPQPTRKQFWSLSRCGDICF